MYPREKLPVEKEFDKLFTDFLNARGTPKSNSIQDSIAKRMQDDDFERLPSDARRFAQLIMGEM